MSKLPQLANTRDGTPVKLHTASYMVGATPENHRPVILEWYIMFLKRKKTPIIYCIYFILNLLKTSDVECQKKDQKNPKQNKDVSLKTNTINFSYESWITLPMLLSLCQSLGVNPFSDFRISHLRFSFTLLSLL